MYGIRVALGHKSRTFGYPDPTLHVPTNPTAWTVSTTSRGQFRSTEVAERPPGTPQACWRWTTAVRPREASIVQHSCLHADPTNVVASPSSWSPQPRSPLRRAASSHYLRLAHITGRGSARYPLESMAVVIVVRVRARHCICARHDRVNSDIHSYVRHPRSALSRFRDTRRWGWIRGTTWNVWRRCMVCDSPRMPSVGNSLSPSRAHDSSLGGLSALIYPR